MKLSGDYDVKELIRALQGNFSCQYVTKNSKNKPLPLEEQKITLELFFLHIEIFPVTGEIIVYRVADDPNSTKKLVKLVTLEGK